MQYLIKKSMVLLVALVVAQNTYGQVRLGNGDGQPSPSAVLELTSGQKGFLPPRLTTEQRDAIKDPSEGLIIYNTNLRSLQLFSSAEWLSLATEKDKPVFPPRLHQYEIEALPSPSPGDLVYDLTVGCLKHYNGSQWICNYKKPGDPAMEGVAWRAGGTNNDESYDLAVDAAGNVYVTGAFYGTAQFGEVTLTAAVSDIFLAKYSSSGTLLWVKQAGGASSDYGFGLTIDPAGYVYMVGSFYGSATFGNLLVTAPHGTKHFIAKYNADGEAIWVRAAEGNGSSSAGSVVTDVSGNIFMTGGFADNIQLGEKSLNSTFGSQDIFLASYDADGNLRWVQTAGGREQDYARKMAVDKSGNVYITGRIIGPVNFSAVTLTGHGGADAFVAKYSGTGELQWVKNAGGPNLDEGQGIAVDAEGDVYLTGSFYHSYLAKDTTLLAVGGYNEEMFIAKFDQMGEEVWVLRGGGSNYDKGQDIAIKPDGTICVVGYFERTYSQELSLGNKSINTGSTNIAIDVIVARLDRDGKVLLAHLEGGTNIDRGTCVAVGPDGKVYVFGTFAGDAYFGRSYLSSAGNLDFFIVRYDE